MARKFIGNVSVHTNPKGEIVLKRDVEGKWDATTVVALLAKVQELAKKHKLPINDYTIYTPAKVDPEATIAPILLSNKWGAPFIALLPKPKVDETAKEAKKPTKLA
jgi:hypothetical protein